MKRYLLTALAALLALSLLAQQGKATPVYLDESKPVKERIEDALARMTLEEKNAMIRAQSKFSTPGVPRLGIPELHMSDGPHGVRAEVLWGRMGPANWTNDSCTAFPALTALAATFNPDLSLEYGRALGEEARFRNKDIILGPGVNIYRTPMNGRNFEYMGEDPLLASKMVVPYVHGVQENGVAACVKHFVLNNQEQWRREVNVELSDRALYELYLPAFKASVFEGKTWVIMGSYNKYNGQYTSHHERLNKILKKDWAFDGVLLSDWGSVHSTDEAAYNGLDIEMGTAMWNSGWGFDDYYMASEYLNKLKEGKLPMSTIDDKVRRIMLLNYRTTMDRSRPFGSLASPEHADVARRVAEESIVLMKNDKNIFPIAKNKYSKILVIGENASKALTLGGGSSELKVKQEISPLEGLRDLYGADKIEYTQGYSSNEKVNADSLREQALYKAKHAEIVLYIGGLNKNYGQDSEGGDRKTYDLPYAQNELITDLLKVNSNTGIVLISGNAVAMPWLNKAPALMQSWYLGSQAGPATANVISGAINPSGKMPYTIPVKLEDNGAHHYGIDSYPGDEKTKTQTYKEDILVGYRWHDTKDIKPQFPFGHGLSYTQFKYGKATSNKTEYTKNDDIIITFEVSNTGAVNGSETAQVYVSQKNPSLVRPTKELKGFKKTSIKAGTTERVQITIPASSLAYYDDVKQDWVLENDEFTLHCAASAGDIKSSVKIQIK